MMVVMKTETYVLIIIKSRQRRADVGYFKLYFAA